jgi:hypothetical protein
VPASEGEVPNEGDDLLWLGGIDPDTGLPAVPPMPIAEAARAALARPGDVASHKARSGVRSAGRPFGVDLTRLDEAGWGVVFPSTTPDEVRQALQPLIEHRRAVTGDALFKQMTWRPGLTARRFCELHGVTPGNLEPESLPFYLLLVGPPTEIPFEFQYQLAVDYAVGRVAFDTAAEYAAYARSVVRAETGQTAGAAKELFYWGPRNEEDRATALSSSLLIDPLASGLQGAAPRLARPIHAEVGWAMRRADGEGATRASLLDALTSSTRPAVLFTASHGLACASGSARQAADQGALVAADWGGRGPVAPEHCLGAADVPDDAPLDGLIAFFFACYSAGTPDRDAFVQDLTRTGAPPAPAPFMSALPRRLLTNPRGGALAVIGHVDRAWACSFRPPPRRPPQIGPFRNALGSLLRGEPTGYALNSFFGSRYAALSTDLLSATAPTLPAAERPDDLDLIGRWVERNDAQAYVVLGDPAARISPR